jgi:hypothetical protein
MHQRRTLRPTLSRFVMPLTVAALLAIGFVTVTAAASGCFPLCVIYTPDNPEWILFACFLCG